MTVTPPIHVPPLLEAVRDKVTRFSRGSEDNRQQAAEHVQNPKGSQFLLRPHVMIVCLGGLFPARFAAAGEIPQVHFCLAIDGNPQGILALVRRLVFPLDVLENRIRLSNSLDRFGLLHTPQTVSQAVEDVADGFFTGQFLVFPAFLLDQRLTHGFGRDPGVPEGGLKLGILLALRFGQGPDILFQPRNFFFGFAIATRRRIIQTRDSRP